ncbi:MAG: type II toxin-antitoxin system PemK/MazF family toxin [Tunicatimonas sp.]|uniref:type II toxin-antitoxin system PemK/MazF family toxin n=1 Tax=Tunicatimonas sp. TaxID=1940096 RepID=UPI003C7209EA
MKFEQYCIAIVNLNPTIGSEIKKTRPCIIISPDEMNKHLKKITIAPITSQSKAYPTRMEINIRSRPNWVVIDQIRTIDKSRITRTVGKLTDGETAKIKEVIRETFVD